MKTPMKSEIGFDVTAARGAAFFDNGAVDDGDVEVDSRRAAADVGQTNGAAAVGLSCCDARLCLSRLADDLIAEAVVAVCASRPDAFEVALKLVRPAETEPGEPELSASADAAGTHATSEPIPNSKARAPTRPIAPP